METRGEQYDFYAQNAAPSEVDVLFDDNPEGFSVAEIYDDTQTEQGEQETLESTQSYAEGPDGSLYLYNTQTGELDLSQPMQPYGDQVEAFQTALTVGAAMVELLAPGSTETQEIWSIQTITSSVTPDNRRILTIQATTEIREKPKEEIEEDRTDTPESGQDTGIDYVADHSSDLIITIDTETPAAPIVTVPTADSHFETAPTVLRPIPSVEKPSIFLPLEQEAADSGGDFALPSEFVSEPAILQDNVAQELPFEAASVEDTSETTDTLRPIETVTVADVTVETVESNPHIIETPTLEVSLLAEELPIDAGVNELETSTIEPVEAEAADENEPTDEERLIEKQPLKTPPQKLRVVPSAAPKVLKPEKVVYLRDRRPARAIVTSSKTAKTPTIAAETTQSKPVKIAKRRQNEAPATVKEQPHSQPVEAATMSLAEEISAPITERAICVAPEQAKTQPREAIGTVEHATPAAHHNSLAAPSGWEQANTAQNLMPWLSGYVDTSFAEDDIIISFTAGGTNRKRRTRARSLAA